jgi:multidrug efflux pump subunit AcrB
VRLGQAEDPDFTFKLMVVRTGWPGASAEEVERQVTDRIESKLQETPRLDFLRSYSKPGESVVFVFVKDSSRPDEIRDTWYQVRKKVGDIRGTLPAGHRRARPSTTNSATRSATSTRSPATASPTRSSRRRPIASATSSCA